MSDIHVVAILYAREGREDALRADLMTVTQKSAAEEGNLRYELFADANDGRRFVLVEHWRDAGAQGKHHNRSTSPIFMRTAKITSSGAKPFTFSNASPERIGPAGEARRVAAPMNCGQLQVPTPVMAKDRSTLAACTPAPVSTPDLQRRPVGARCLGADQDHRTAEVLCLRIYGDILARAVECPARGERYGSGKIRSTDLAER
ncbi:putative monooxygenase YcnE [Ensifer psoraleae]|uniref:putative quinol monooxygenase n=1 Tax=Sinorhizobium psoraleae TaxID=520838 RepID=UPI001AEED9A9|nr:putative quinol monooxygenase [Sinorhizobium psoraleae]NRP69401.1 putative monooxygenase YcnE [Sinorhizobium psoraleae]